MLRAAVGRSRRHHQYVRSVFYDRTHRSPVTAGSRYNEKRQGSPLSVSCQCVPGNSLGQTGASTQSSAQTPPPVPLPSIGYHELSMCSINWRVGLHPQNLFKTQTNSKTVIITFGPVRRLDIQRLVESRRNLACGATPPSVPASHMPPDSSMTFCSASSTVESPQEPNVIPVPDCAIYHPTTAMGAEREDTFSTSPVGADDMPYSAALDGGCRHNDNAARLPSIAAAHRSLSRKSTSRHFSSDPQTSSEPATSEGVDQGGSATSTPRVEEPAVTPTKAAGSATKRGLRAVVREVLSTMPGGALVVMQQQHIVMRYLTVKLRAWRQARRSLRGAKTRSGGRRSRARHRRARLGAKPTRVSSEPTASSVGFLKEATVLVKPPKPAVPDSSAPSTEQATAVDATEPSLAGTAVGPEESALAALQLQKEPSEQQRVPRGTCVGGTLPSSQQAAESVATPTGPQRPSSQYVIHDKSELLRNYEAVLNVVMSAGVVGLEEKRFLSEYRKRCGISELSHVESISRLGWTMKEFEAGHLMAEAHREPRLRRLWRQVLDLCDSKGNYIVTMGSLSSLLSITMSSMVHLRVLQVVAGFLYFAYNMTRRPPLLSAGYWNIVFFLINGFMLLRLFLESRPETFSDDELDVFDAYFLNTGLRPRQFKKLLAAAQWRTIPSGELLVRQGEPVKHLTILCRGELAVSINDHEVERLTGGDSNAVIGVKTFLSKLQVERSRDRDASPTAATVQLSTGGTDRPDAAVEGCTQSEPDETGPGKPLRLAAAEPPLDVAPKSTSQEPGLPPTTQEPGLPPGLVPGPGSSTTAAEPIASSTTVTATLESRILVWPMDLLVERVKADPVNLGFALVAFMGKSLVHRARSQSARQTFASYETVLQAVLTDGNVLAEERQLLNTCRQRFGISEEQHLELLDRFGWTPEEFEVGRKSGKSAKSSDFSRTWSNFFS